MIYATTMVGNEQRHEGTLCRLCLESIVTSHETAGVDLLENAEVQKMLQDVYELQVQALDNSPSMMCMPCYQQLIKNYTYRMKLLMLRKTFRINQTMLLTQIKAFEGTSADQSASKPNESDTTSEEEKPTQTEETAPTSTTTEKRLENPFQECDMIKPSSSTPSLSNTTITKATTAKPQKQLVPIVLDCLKEPLYGKALWPLVLSTDRDDPAPLMLLCSTCHKTFNANDRFDQHQSKGCVPCCRYCLAETVADHSCPFLKKYSSIMPYIVGSSKYVSTNTIPKSVDNAAAASDAPVEPDVCDEPKVMKLKHSERVSSVEHRSVTPNLRQRNSSSSSSSAKTSKSSKIQSQPNPMLAAALSAVSHRIQHDSSSDNEPLTPITNRQSSDVSSASSSRKRKRSTK